VKATGKSPSGVYENGKGKVRMWGKAGGGGKKKGGGGPSTLIRSLGVWHGTRRQRESWRAGGDNGGDSVHRRHQVRLKRKRRGEGQYNKEKEMRTLSKTNAYLCFRWRGGVPFKRVEKKTKA